MSWSIDVAGKKEHAGKIVAEQLDKVAQSYDGTEEGRDAMAAKERVLALIVAMDIDDEYDEVFVRAHGSHTWSEKGILSANLSIAIGRGRSGRRGAPVG